MNLTNGVDRCTKETPANEKAVIFLGSCELLGGLRDEVKKAELDSIHEGAIYLWSSLSVR